MAARKRRGARERRGAENSSAVASSAIETGQEHSGLSRGDKKREPAVKRKPKAKQARVNKKAAKPLKDKAKPSKAKPAKAKPAKPAKAKPAKAKLAKAKPAKAKPAKSKPAKAKPAKSKITKAKAKPAKAKLAKAKPAKSKLTKAELKAEDARLEAQEVARAKARARSRARRRAKLREEREAEARRVASLERARARARRRAAEKKRREQEAEERRLLEAKKARQRRLDEKRRIAFETVFKREVKTGEIVVPKRGAVFTKGSAHVSCHRVGLFRADIKDRLEVQVAFVMKLARELEKKVPSNTKPDACVELGVKGDKGIKGDEKPKKVVSKYWVSFDYLTYKKGNLRGDTMKLFAAPKVSRQVALQHYQSKGVTKVTLKKRARELLMRLGAGPELLLFSICVGLMPPAETERERQRRLLEDVFQRESASGEIQVPKGSQIIHNSNYGDSYTISHAVHLTRDDVCDQFEDLVSTCVSSADDLNGYMRRLPDAIQAQALPRFWTTYEFLVFDSARKRGSPKTFFISSDKGKEEIAAAYDGHKQVYFDDYEEAVRQMFRDIATGPEILIFSIIIGGTFRGLKKKRRRVRGNRRRGRRARGARRALKED